MILLFLSEWICKLSNKLLGTKNGVGKADDNDLAPEANLEPTYLPASAMVIAIESASPTLATTPDCIYVTAQLTLSRSACSRVGEIAFGFYLVDFSCNILLSQGFVGDAYNLTL